jgi:hypothetical protein
MDTLKIKLKVVLKIGWERICVVQYREKKRAPVSMLMGFQVPENAGNFLTNSETTCFSRKVLFSGFSCFHKVQ